MGEAKPKLTSAHYPQPLTGDQPEHIDGLPLGTRGGMKFRHNFPADGEYRFSIPRSRYRPLHARRRDPSHRDHPRRRSRSVSRGAGRTRGSEDRSIRAAHRARAEIMKRFTNIPVQVKAGTYDVGGHVHRAGARRVGRIRRLPARRRVQPRRSRAAPDWRRARSWGRSTRRACRRRRAGEAIFICRRAGESGQGVRPPHRREPRAPRVPASGHRRRTSIR